MDTNISANTSANTCTNKSTKILNLAHDGYRRAGIAFTKGENALPKLDKAQLAQIEADPRLKLLSKAGVSALADNGQAQSGAVDNTASAAELIPKQAPDNTPVKSTNEQDDNAQDDSAQVFSAIASLSLDNKDHFTVSGKPQAAELEKRLNRSVSASERDAMWQAYQDNQAQTEEKDA
ncbi:HI1506-related protein [uncultured Shewanella sp.]|uniref:HI1506-related protein n=1 Tax=uncultured Shewanella sp. TaxID=173975 RepID=UPI00262C2F47|nr:HI1506-related protein [uncultured Shewanella sp.]